MIKLVVCIVLTMSINLARAEQISSDDIDPAVLKAAAEEFAGCYGVYTAYADAAEKAGKDAMAEYIRALARSANITAAYYYAHADTDPNKDRNKKGILADYTNIVESEAYGTKLYIAMLLEAFDTEGEAGEALGKCTKRAYVHEEVWEEFRKQGILEKQTFNDVKGWHKTYWGMPPSELEQTYQTNLKKSCKDDGGRCIYTLQPVELYGVPFDVEFHLAKGAKLNRVHVSKKSKKEAQLKLAEQIEAELKEKYGPPKVLNDEREHTEPRIADDGRPIPGSNTLELQWVFPSTTITYYRSITKYLATNATVVHSVISLDYKASDQSQF